MKLDKLKNTRDMIKAKQKQNTKRDVPKTYTPPQHKAKKLGVIAFWFAAALLLVGVLALANLVLSGNATQATAEPEEVNQATSAAGVEFAKRFAQEFFTWEADADGFKAREEKLSPFLGEGLDKDAGLETSGQRWDANVKKVNVLHVQETGKQQAVVLVEVTQTLKKENEEDADKTDKAEVLHTLAVPIEHAGGFGLYELPSFAAPPAGSDVAKTPLPGDSAARADVQEITEFLQTFFQSYVNDTPDKLAYFMSGENVQGLEGSKELGAVDVQDVRTAGDGWAVLASVELTEPETGTVYYSNYLLSVTEENGRYLVKSINKGAN